MLPITVNLYFKGTQPPVGAYDVYEGDWSIGRTKRNIYKNQFNTHKTTWLRMPVEEPINKPSTPVWTQFDKQEEQDIGTAAFMPPHEKKK